MLINYIQPCGSIGRLSYEFGEGSEVESLFRERRLGYGRDHAGTLVIVFKDLEDWAGPYSLYYRDSTGKTYRTDAYPYLEEVLEELTDMIQVLAGIEAWAYKLLEKGDAKCS